MTRARKLVLAGGVTLVVAAVTAVGVLQSDWMREHVRQKLIGEIANATGARVELGRFDYRWQLLEVELTNLVLHGTEAPTQAPLLRVPSVRLRLGLGAWRERRIELRSLAVKQPEAHIYVDAQGKTNIPHPAHPSNSNTIADLLRLQIGEASLERAHVVVDAREYNFSVHLKDLDSTLRYALRPERYDVALRIEKIDLGARNPALRVEGQASLEATRLRIATLHINVVDPLRTHPRTWLALNGAVEDFAHPTARGVYAGNIDVEDVPHGTLRAGVVEASGDWHWSERDWGATAVAKARGLDFVIQRASLKVDAADGRCDITRAGIACATLHGSLFGGAFAGSGAWAEWARLDIGGAVRDVQVLRLRPLVDVLPPTWDARATGTARFAADWAGAELRNTLLKARVHAAPHEGGWPLEGDIDVTWNAARKQILFADSALWTPATRVEFAGELDKRLNVKLASTDAADLESGLRQGLQRDDVKLPFHLERGRVEAAGTLDGPLLDPAVDARVTLTGAVYDNTRIDEVTAHARVANSHIDLTDVQLRHGEATATGAMAATLERWRVTGQSRLDGALTVKQGDLTTIARLLGAPEAAGRADITLRVQGLYDRPEAQLRLKSNEIAWAGERVKNVDAELRFRNATPEEIELEATADGAHYSVRGRFEHPTLDWRNGRLEFAASVAKLAVPTIENVSNVRTGLDGMIDGELHGVLRIDKARAKPERLEGRIAATKLKLDGAELGHAELVLAPLTNAAKLDMSATLEGARITATGKAAFNDDLDIDARLHVPRLSLRLLRALGVVHTDNDEPLPVRGFLEGSAEMKLALLRTKSFKATAEITTMQLRPRSNEILDTQIDPSDLTLRNAGPIRLDADHTGVRVHQARFVARRTDLTLDGAYLFDAKQPWDLRITGGVDLAIVSTYRPDLQTAGSARIDAQVRGAGADPQLSGRMTITNASLFLRDVPNGIERANGTIYFERNRAQIEKLSGTTGSGTFELNGFVAFGAQNSYRLQAKANSVRVRYPEGVSTLLDAELSLTGTNSRSLLAGTVTIARSGFSAQTDLAGMVSQSGSPVPLVATDNEFLRNMQFDVRIRTTPNATLVSQYTQDIQTEADLRLRGSLIKPVLLGRVQVHQGLVQFFGNRYQVSRGEMLFYSTATLAPSIDLDLETRIRGVTVYINVSGPLNRLKVNYRSDPPLQANEILALLTVGRAPAAQSTALPTATGAANPAVTENSTNSLLGGALSGAVSARVERFFGASRIKIDPQVTGVDNIPQSRITVEQSISRDITLTFVTNLNRAQQQVVRFEWDMSREWSLIAVRDENGVFGVDFLFKKRFK